MFHLIILFPLLLLFVKTGTSAHWASGCNSTISACFTEQSLWEADIIAHKYKEVMSLGGSDSRCLCYISHFPSRLVEDVLAVTFS